VAEAHPEKSAASTAAMAQSMRFLSSLTAAINNLS
jgi:hypothetical protein